MMICKRNGRLFVQTTFDGSDKWYTGFPSYAEELDLLVFENREQMAQWEYAAYASYGLDKCDAERIETLGELFGNEFQRQWNKRGNVLLAVSTLPNLRQEVKALQARISNLEAQIINPSDHFPFWEKPS